MPNKLESKIEKTYRQLLIDKRRNVERIVVYVSGISGTGSSDYLKLQQKLAEANNKHFEILETSQFISNVLGRKNIHKPLRNFLNLTSAERQDILYEAYSDIKQVIDDNPDMDFVIDGHMLFHWRGDIKRGYNTEMMLRINPDLVVNIIEHADDIAERLQSGAYGSQWSNLGLDRDGITEWLINDWHNCKEVADSCKSPWMIITRYFAPTTLFMAMYYPEAPWVYFAQQMSSVAGDKDTYEAADRFFDSLIRRGVIFNPKGYELKDLTTHNMAGIDFTWARDIEGWVGNVDGIVQYYHSPIGHNNKVKQYAANIRRIIIDDHTKEMVERQLTPLVELALIKNPIPSYGMASEATAMRLSMGDVYTIWDGDTASPFTYTTSTPGKVFRTAEQLMADQDFNDFAPLQDITIPQKILDDAYSIKH